VVSLSLDAIIAIRATEEEARQEIQRAQEAAQQAIEAAHRDGKARVASTITRAEAEIAHLTRAMDNKATDEAMELASSTANRQATLLARADRRLDAAAMLIFERIVSV